MRAESGRRGVVVRNDVRVSACSVPPNRAARCALAGPYGPKMNATSLIAGRYS